MAQKAKKFLVTGGTGFIGSSLVRRLVKHGYEVRVLDNDLRGADHRLQEALHKVEMVKADIRDAKAVLEACRGVDSVIHLAYLNGTEYFYTMPELVLDIGVKGMINIIDACRELGIKDLVLASSSEVYQTPPQIPTDETAPLIIPDIMNPRYSYGGGKMICELMAINYGRKYFDRSVIFRPHNVYGPDMGWEHVVPQFIMRMKDLAQKSHSKAIDFPMQGTGAETRSFIYIEDFTDALMLVIEKGEHLNIYHIGTEEELSIADVAREIGHYFHKDISIIPGALTKGSTPRRCPDITKIKALGFKATTSLHDGIKLTADWYTKHEQPKQKVINKQ